MCVFSPFEQCIPFIVFCTLLFGGSLLTSMKRVAAEYFICMKVLNFFFHVRWVRWQYCNKVWGRYNHRNTQSSCLWTTKGSVTCYTFIPSYSHWKAVFQASVELVLFSSFLRLNWALAFTKVRTMGSPCVSRLQRLIYHEHDKAQPVGSLSSTCTFQASEREPDTGSTKWKILVRVCKCKIFYSTTS